MTRFNQQRRYTHSGDSIFDQMVSPPPTAALPATNGRCGSSKDKACKGTITCSYRRDCLAAPSSAPDWNCISCPTPAPPVIILATPAPEPTPGPSPQPCQEINNEDECNNSDGCNWSSEDSKCDKTEDPGTTTALSALLSSLLESRGGVLSDVLQSEIVQRQICDITQDREKCNVVQAGENVLNRFKKGRVISSGDLDVQCLVHSLTNNLMGCGPKD